MKRKRKIAQQDFKNEYETRLVFVCMGHGKKEDS